MKEQRSNDIATLLSFAKGHKVLTYFGMILSGLAMLLSMIPYICIWLVARDLIAVAPNWAQATNITTYGWIAFGFAVGGILIYFIGLICTHLAAFRTASNIRKEGMARMMKAPLGYFDSNASGLIRNKIDAAAADTETLLAHNLADIVGTIVMFISMIVLMFVFDWVMGIACLLAAAISIIAMFSMMGGKNAKFVMEYQTALDRMSKAGTEYVRGIPVVKVFQQTVYSFRAFKEAIEDYSKMASYFQEDACRTPQSINLTFTEGAFVFLVPVALILAPYAVMNGDFGSFVTNFAFYAVFSAIISTSLARIMFVASGVMLAQSAVQRMSSVFNAPQLTTPTNPKTPANNSIEFKNVTFTYEGATRPALEDISFVVESRQTVALVGPSGGGKTTAASLIPRFWDVTKGSVEVGGVDVKEIDPHALMDHIAFVFQNNHLFKTSIFENVVANRPQATREEVMQALQAAQCQDIIDKLPDGIDTVIGTKSTFLSGGEQQRIALAGAILKNAPIVVLDEATAFADPENECLFKKHLMC